MELGAVGRALCLLEVLSRCKSSNLETLSRETGLPKATALRLLSALVDHGYVSRDSTDRYSLTLRMFTVGSRALKNVEFLEVASPVAGQLRDKTGETVHIGILEGNRAVYVLKRESLYTIRMNSRVGKSIPLHCSAIGKCLLAAQGDEAVESYIREEGLKCYTPKTICDPDAFRREIAKVRDQGYAFDDEEHETGIFCVAAPVRDTYGDTVAAMSMSTPTFRLDRSNIDVIVKEVCASCDEISVTLGYIDK
ncbi:MAG: IclR family transcriptional regulator [Spirochaetales bacterium]|nr:IclR family transcriptional regulator [Spirochaetales bacterium]